jgi:L,D-transpeptidase YcfS
MANFLFADMVNKKYSISVCTTSNLENALTCKKRIQKDSKIDVFIVKEKSNKFITYLGLFNTNTLANKAIKVSSNYVKEQKPFTKEISENTINQLNLDLLFIDNNQNINLEIIEKKESDILIIENKKVFDNDSVDKANYGESNAELSNSKEVLIKSDSEINTKKESDILIIENQKVVNNDFDEIKYKEELKEKLEKNLNKIKKNELNSELSNFEEIFIEVDSKINTMIVKAKLNNEFTILNTYKVSTGRNNIKKPKGLGKISEITLNPIWYPTQDTLKSFRKKGIYLPAAVPGGHKLNYMGAAKLNLTHTVNGLQTFRIHGTLSENTIGTNESAGCIRMKNDEVVQLANLLKDFTKYKSLENVQVYLK